MTIENIENTGQRQIHQDLEDEIESLKGEALRLFVEDGQSIFTLTDNALQKIIEDGVFPEGMTLRGIEERDDFERLWRFRANPSKLAGILLKQRMGAKVKDTPEAKAKRLELKALELRLKEERGIQHSEALKRIFKKLDSIEIKLDVVMRYVVNRRLEHPQS